MRDDDRLKLQRLIFYKEDVELIDKILQMFLKRSQAKSSILIDKEGHLITMHGDTQNYDMDTVSTLLAGTFAATREWAKLLGEEEFSVLYHQGKRDSIQVTLVGDRTLLAVIFDDRTQLGLVRLMCAEVVKKLEKVFEEAEKRRVNMEPMPLELGDFKKGATDMLNILFGDEEPLGEQKNTPS